MTTYVNTDWTRGPIGPGWFMLFAPVTESGGVGGRSPIPTQRPDHWKYQKLPELPDQRREKAEDFAAAWILLMDD